MDAARFARVASLCRNWSDRSLSVARALLVDGDPLSRVAEAHDMKPQQASVIRARFVKKDTPTVTSRVKAFMQREEPKGPISRLEAFSTDIKTLRDKGYTVEQIVAFLAENGVEVRPDVVQTFLESIGP